MTQLSRALSWYTKVVGSIPSHGTYKNQPMMHKQVEKQINVCLSLSACLSLHLTLSLSQIIYFKMFSSNSTRKVFLFRNNSQVPTIAQKSLSQEEKKQLLENESEIRLCMCVHVRVMPYGSKY